MKNAITIDDIAKTTRSLLSDKNTNISTNSEKVAGYIISEAGKTSSLFVVGNNSYQIYKEVEAMSDKMCVYEDAYHDENVYPLELNRNSEDQRKKVENQIASGSEGVLFCSHISKKIKVHVEKAGPGVRTIRVGEKTNKKDVVESAKLLGYEKVETTRYPGEISSRGGIVDVFTVNEKNPTRIDFFGDVVDSIRLFNPTSQLSIKETDSVSLYSNIKNIKSVKSITYKEFIKKYNYKLIYINVNEGVYIISNKESQVYKNIIKINTNPILEHKPNKETFELEIKTNNNSFRYKKTSDDNGEISKKNNVYKYEQISKHLVIKYNNNEKNNHAGNTSEITGTIHNYKWGDYITHEDFGVGVYRGIVTKNSNDYIKTEFNNNSTVLVSVHKIYKICPYIGTPRPSLNTIGNKAWSRKIIKTKERVQKIIEEMVVVNKNRVLSRTNIIYRDDLIEGALEKSFPYIETVDQKKAINDVYDDMGTPGLMDRIIIGDVGFGKTEVAIRAAVRCVVSGGFAMVVVPTTILADQHYISFRGRLEKLGIKVEMLSRFVSNKNKKKICKSIVDNKVDILVGTHAILNDNIPKNRLALIVIDEEHKFGVQHKNKLLKMRRAVDILTLSATPIPRTLQQSLLGIRDVSLIQTPPINRLPIKTRVLYKDWDHIGSLIKKEFLRDGQVYFLHNRVETLPVLFERLKLMFPDTNIAMAHGKMPSKELEGVVLSFFSGDVKMLVCTSIVESGLDVSNANTIIISNAHLFGLSQLYQIRGRVGRGKRQAYCYLTIPDVSALSVDAVQRLRAIESSVDLGSGYNIALKDLEIRGSGNLFGYEQSGSIDKVGYHLYCKMFEQALQKSADGDVFLPTLQINSVFSSSFDTKYMPLSEDRIFYYQRIASSFEVNDLDVLKLEVVDRFGPLVRPAENVFLLAKLRVLYARSMVSKIDINERSVVFSFHKKDTPSFDSYLDSVFLKLSAASVQHSFKQPSDDVLLVDIPVDKNNESSAIAFNCVDFFIYNEKNR